MTKRASAITLNFFPKGDDLPIFSGAPVQPRERCFDPQVQTQQAAMFDLRLDPFHTRQEARRAKIAAVHEKSAVGGARNTADGIAQSD